MINIILVIIILALICYILYNKQSNKLNTQNEINKKYNSLYNKYIPYHTNGSFNSNEDKKIELFRVLNENKNYDLIDELFGSPWYSILLKEVDNIIKK